MKPALTPEEWAEGIFENRSEEDERGLIEIKAVRIHRYSNERGVWNSVSVRGGFAVNKQNLQALAAFCLIDQPFGFTREDVDLLRAVDVSARSSADISMAEKLKKQAQDLADRIEALLPPEQEAEG